jgi:hypothetical protein
MVAAIHNPMKILTVIEVEEKMEMSLCLVCDDLNVVPTSSLYLSATTKVAFTAT